MRDVQGMRSVCWRGDGMNHQITLEELGIIPKSKEVQKPKKAIQRDYAFPCGGCICNHCANSVECFDECTGEADFGCFSCDECSGWDGKEILDNWRERCDQYKVTNIYAKRIRRKFKTVRT